ncbi:Zn(II)2Cys6 transcription factor [Aspergillus clavatus NRRL 1]|uniref:C6 finger domain protein, putative n=1 Tax=Aspergillus clavatus (strain ATCC 1007 / CBS 513.65 / DSM 816 / NCTC 3887 / NRRL 1 / QM 1276 / 107) TaxID=344612 RepID=A1CMM9_ASPCL|nr:C6 finger domain protein, putative [Aspergillus clavatus NRRL 1]EAW08816.1 C6 finger domain protein, putative [Aspergillus clavatus NRRL 1]
MESIKIPPPSAIIDHPSPVSSSISPRQPTSSTRKTTPPERPTTKLTANRPKQSKSRNGCITCKTKRLKCDESKPTCLQCKKRNVECGGYQKNFKWRPFEETNVIGRCSNTKPRKTEYHSSGIASRRQSCDTSTTQADKGQPLPSTRAQISAPAASSADLNDSASAHLLQLDELFMSNPSRLSDFQDDLPPWNRDPSDASLDGKYSTPELTDISPIEPFSWLSDLVPSPAEIQSPSKRILPKSTSHDLNLGSDEISFAALLEQDHEDIEDIVRQSEETDEDRGSISSGAMAGMSRLSRGPSLSSASPEMLVLHFDQFTCGILSVKDGSQENPWRTLIWPLAKETPALYHAIFALAAFHSSKTNTALRVHGVDHMRQSITCMVQDIQSMRTDAALATSLALAFADTWDQHTRTCIQHLRGAKALVAQVVAVAAQRPEDIDRTRFLYHTWLYMDVIARLTSREDEGDPLMDVSIFQQPKDAVHEIDPLMGCATTLFPLIDRVARLIQRVRKTESNSISLVSQAIDLKRLVEQWEPPDWFEPPEYPTSEVQHSIQMAHAYRWATLLYLHQAVPEMPSEPASALAKRTLMLLATVPPSSRTTIIQMFPLLAAGCEAEPGEDREWVLNRWAAIQSRLMLGSIDRCIEVVKEVWTRRDSFENLTKTRLARGSAGISSCRRGSFAVEADEPMNYQALSNRAVSSRLLSGGPRRGSGVSPLENIEFEQTVRGRLHWVNVMQKWGWEGKFCA